MVSEPEREEPVTPVEPFVHDEADVKALVDKDTAGMVE